MGGPDLISCVRSKVRLSLVMLAYFMVSVKQKAGMVGPGTICGVIRSQCSMGRPVIIHSVN